MLTNKEWELLCSLSVKFDVIDGLQIGYISEKY